MNYKNYLLIFLLIITVLFVGSNIQDPNGSKSGTSDKKHIQNISTPFSSPNNIIYTDNMDGVNDTSALMSRGYLIFNLSVPLGSSSWFQGNPNVFVAFNGPTSGYVGANFNSVNNVGNIDNWLVLPRINGGILAGDSLYFWARSTYLDPGFNYPDSIRVMYSANDSIPSGVWAELGRFLVPNPDTAAPNNGYTLYGFKAPATSVNGRFAIRYCVVDGGQNGANSDYIGIDAINIVRSSIGISNINSNVPGNYSISQNYPNPFNPVTKINFALPKSGFVIMKVYDMLGKEVSTLVNQNMKAGNYNVDFNGSNLASGVYVYKIQSNEFTAVKKMMLIK